MRIAIDVSGALGPPSGMRAYIESLVEALAKLPADHEYLCYAAYGSHYPMRSDRFPLPKDQRFQRLIFRIPERLLIMVEERLGLLIQNRLLRRARVNIFHGTANRLPPLPSVPSILTLHHLGGPPETKASSRRFYYEELTRRALRRADRILAISEFTRQEAIRRYDLPGERIETVWEGVDLGAFRSEPDDGWLSAHCPRPYLLFVSSISKRKNLTTLVHAFDILRRRRHLPQRLVFVGLKHPSFAELLGDIRRRGLIPHVQFLENVTARQLATLYRRADAFIYPSLLEGFGLPLLEAMACGTPVVAARATCLPEVGGDAALYFEGLDADDLAHKIDRVLSEATLRASLTEKGLMRVQRFRWEETARKTLHAYEAVVARQESSHLKNVQNYQ